MLPSAKNRKPRSKAFGNTSETPPAFVPILIRGYNSRRMTLPNSTRLGPYEIIAPLGTSVEWAKSSRARDTRLGRESSRNKSFLNPSRRKRPPRPLRTGSPRRRALNHPNILSRRIRRRPAQRLAFLVSELLEGETLRAVLDQGRFPQRKADRLRTPNPPRTGRRPRKGIVHRDP